MAHTVIRTSWRLVPKLIVGLIPSMLLLPSMLLGQEAGNERLEKVTVVSEGSQEIEKVIWLGIEGGGAYTEPYDDAIEVAKSGYNLGIKSAFSASTDTVTFDFGLGWVFNKLTALDELPPASQASAENPNPYSDAEEISTSFGLAEVAARWRVNPNFELGPSMAATFGEDTSFGPVEDEEDYNVPNVFLGGSLAFLTSKPNYRQRFVQRISAQFLTDISIHERQVFLVSLQLQFGMLVGSQPRVLVKEKVRTEVKTEVKYKTRVERDVQVVEKIRDNYVVDAGIINFETASYTLPAEMNPYLQELAQFLLDRSDDWSELKIIGHTDKRGDESYNQELSEQRTQAVAEVLRASGLADDKIVTKSLAASTPVDEAEQSISLARNRRVEILIVGGEKTPQLKEAILRLQQKYRLPITCQGSDCR